MQKSEADIGEIKPESSNVCESAEPIGNDVEEKDALSSDSPIAKLDSIQKLDVPENDTTESHLPGGPISTESQPSSSDGKES